MADNTVLNAGTGGDTMSTDDIAGIKVQRVKVQFGVDGVATDVAAGTPLPTQDQAQLLDNAAFVDGTSKVMPMGFAFDEVAGTALTENDIGAARINANRGQVLVLEDGVTRARYATVTATNALKVDGSAVTQPTQDAGELVDNAGYTDGTSKVLPAGYIYDEIAGTALTENDVAAARINVNRGQVGVIEDGATRARYATVTAANALKTDGSAVTQPVSIAAGSISVVGTGVEATAQRVTIASDSTGVLTVKQATAANLNATVIAAGDVAHAGADAGNPVKFGMKALSALPAAVATTQRANAIGDLYGRQLISHIPPEIQKFKGATYSSTQTGVAVWTPAAGNKIVITHVVIACGGTTAGRVILWFGATADTTYTEGTDQVVVDCEMAPSATTRPGLVLCPPVPIFGITVDHVLRITTDAGITVHISVYGYERT